ncbi:MAG: GAF domain-containing protein [Myxococcota bacterium]|nr:GAF domain-containing protein [Myxococcota bacterium]
MAPAPPTSPTSLAPAAFGQADLSNCEREQIHLAGGIQPHGALLVVGEPDLVVLQASVNASAYLGLDERLLGRRLDELPGDLAASLVPHPTHPLHEIPSALRCQIGDPAVDFDGLLHRPPRGGLVVELERASPVLDLSEEIAEALQVIRSAASIRDLCDETARIFREIAGYDRAMVYRFDDEGHGEVLSERRDPKLDSYLGQRYPASDIPQMARRLYERNRVRVLVDVEDERIALEPRLSPITGEDLDMSLCFLRAMSPIHIQYLKNMGVRATLVASLVVGDRLWGLVACHHYAPRRVQYEVRAACELLAEAVATRIAALESFAQAQAELSVRRLEQRIAEVVSRDGDWRHALFDGSATLLQPLQAGGAALLFEEDVATVGEVPGTSELREIGAWLDRLGRSPVLATASLGLDEPAFGGLGDVASGLVAAPLSNAPGEYLMWFRPARVRTITWGGNPFKPFAIGDDPADLSPRRSFAQWHQQVEGTSEPWLPADLAAAKLIGETVADVILQFRSVRVLIAQDQLGHVRRRVQSSEHPVIVADPDGRILLTNEALERLLSAGHPHLEWIADLPPLFAEPAELRGMLADLVSKRRSFRTESALRTERGAARPLALRADPVLVPPDRLLGYVILVSDLTERQTAEAARQRFQESLVAEHRFAAGAETETFRHLLASVRGNAQLAALEITDGIDPTRMPPMLESVRASVDRTAEILEQLASRSARLPKRKR